MYRRITTHREKVEAFNAANASAKQKNLGENGVDGDGNHECSANQTYMSDPVQRVTNSSTMMGGFDYEHNFYDQEDDGDNDHGPADQNDDHDRHASKGLNNPYNHEDHSAPPYHHHRHCDNGQQHHRHGCAYHDKCYGNNNIENYSEWEHMYGDVEAEGESGADTAMVQGGGQQHETIFLFDF